MHAEFSSRAVFWFLGERDRHKPGVPDEQSPGALSDYPLEGAPRSCNGTHRAHAEHPSHRREHNLNGLAVTFYDELVSALLFIHEKSHHYKRLSNQIARSLHTRLLGQRFKLFVASGETLKFTRRKAGASCLFPSLAGVACRSCSGRVMSRSSSAANILCRPASQLGNNGGACQQK
jgi:hypothetical protein